VLAFILPSSKYEHGSASKTCLQVSHTTLIHLYWSRIEGGLRHIGGGLRQMGGGFRHRGWIQP
jgi:hypothetical protein